jgi:hypothetical protein
MAAEEQNQDREKYGEHIGIFRRKNAIRFRNKTKKLRSQERQRQVENNHNSKKNQLPCPVFYLSNAFLVVFHTFSPM